MTRPIWIPMHLLDIHKDYFSSNLDTAGYTKELLMFLAVQSSHEHK